MKTKLDELLSKYLQKDKNAANNLSTASITSENIYKIEVAQRAKLVRDSRTFKNSSLKIWNLTQPQDKQPAQKKQTIEFPEILEFALKESNKAKTSTTPKHTISRKPKKNIINKSNAIENYALTNSDNGGVQMNPITNTNATKSKSIKVAKADNTSADATKTTPKRRHKQHVWALKNREERKKAIVQIINKVNYISMLDLCKKYHKEIGVRWPESGKWNENPWKIVRNDCRELAQEKKIEIVKNEKGKSYLRAIQKNAKEIAPPKIEEITESKSLITKPIQSYEDTAISSGIDYNIQEIKQALSALQKEVEKLSSEIMEIWKTLAKSYLK